MTSIDDALAVLRDHRDYRVLKRMDPAAFVAARPKTGTGTIAAVVDVETTGTDPERDEIIEFGAVVFELIEDRIAGIVGTIDELQQPSEPLSDEIVRLTGLTDEVLEGRALDRDRIAAAMEPVSLVIAHNAAFDRRFCERRFDWAAGKFWACSMAEVDWKGLGSPSASLEAIAWTLGFFYDAHRADSDCLALLNALDRPPPGADGDAGPLLTGLLASARQKTAIVWATDSPFEAKDQLKARGYRWHDGSFGRAKCWWLECPDFMVEAECRWLAESVLGGRAPDVAWINGKTRYSTRAML